MTPEQCDAVTRALDMADVPTTGRFLFVEGRPAWVEEDLRDGWLQETEYPNVYRINPA